MSRFSENVRGSILIALSMACYVSNDALMKSLAGELAWYQALALRGGIATLLCAGLAVAVDGRRSLGQILGFARTPACALRLCFEVAATALYLLALFSMPLADATAIVQLLPVLLTIGGALFFGESVGWRRLGAAVAGFVGVLLIVQPGTSAFNPMALFAFAATCSMAARDLATKALPRAIPSTYVTALTIFVVWLMGLGLSATSDWPLLDGWMLARIGAAAVLVSLAFLFGIVAVRIGDMSFMAPFRYAALLWGLLIGFLAFGEMPGPVKLTGAAIIVSAGLYTLNRERRMAARRRARTGPVVHSGRK